MPTDIYFISNVVNWIINLVAFIIAVCYCYRSLNPSYLRIFPLYLFVSIAVELLVNSYLRIFGIQPFGSRQDYARTAIYNLYTPFELFAFAWFLFRIIQSPQIKRLLIASLMLFCLFFIIYSLQTDIGKTLNVIAIVLESLIIIIPCLTWYRELFTRNEPVNLLKEPSFWLVTGIFFYLATIIPFYVTSFYLNSHGLLGVAKSLSSINNFSLVITYMLFIKGFTCRIRRS
ncbi:MAG TPA: hypothetical protein VHD83_01580 [Puia sp.]|nr:hypothetical protein [Puia sp.]